MALTYYIRSWDPRSTYPTNPQEGDICYTITLDQTWAPVGGVKKDNIVKEEIYQNGAWVEQGGGGGGLKTLYDGSVSISTQSSTYPGAYDSAATDLSESVETAPDALAVTVNIPNTTPFVLPYSRNNNAYGLFDGSDPLWSECPIVVALTGNGDAYSQFVASSVMSASLGMKIQAVTVS